MLGRKRDGAHNMIDTNEGFIQSMFLFGVYYVAVLFHILAWNHKNVPQSSTRNHGMFYTLLLVLFFLKKFLNTALFLWSSLSMDKKSAWPYNEILRRKLLRRYLRNSYLRSYLRNTYQYMTTEMKVILVSWESLF